MVGLSNEKYPEFKLMSFKYLKLVVPRERRDVTRMQILIKFRGLQSLSQRHTKLSERIFHPGRRLLTFSNGQKNRV